MMAEMRVLVVDDHDAVRRSLVRALEMESGIDVVGEASDGVAAVRLARDLEPDVVLMDVVMPRLDGIEATWRIRQQCPSTKIIGLSVHDCQTYGSKMLQAGASAYLLKDCDVDDLVREMQTLCESPTYAACGAGDTE